MVYKWFVFVIFINILTVKQVGVDTTDPVGRDPSSDW